MSFSRLVALATLSLGLLTATAGADQAAPTATTVRIAAGTAATPIPNPLFDETRIMRIDLTFSQKEYASLAPHRVAGGGSSQSWLQGAEGHRNGLSASRGLEFPFVHADASIDGKLLKDIGVRYKGNGTFMLGQQVGKMSFKLDFNQYVKGQKLGTVKTLNLHSNVTDASYMNETLAFRLHRDAGSLAPRAGFARVFITVAGKYDRTYYGLFGVVENPDTAFIVARGLPEGGAIFKPVTTSLFADLGTSWAKYNQTYDPKTTLTPAQQQRVIDFSKLVTRASDADFTAQVGQYLEVAQTARYLALVVCLSDLDGILGFGQNYYLYLDPRTNKFSFATWDQDHSFGQFFTGSQHERERLSIERPWREPSKFLTRLMRLDQFRNAYLAEIGALTKTLFTPERLSQQVDELATLLRPAVRDEGGKRLAKFEQAVSGQAAEPDDSMFQGATVPIKPFMRARLASLNQQLGR
jgi:spore coat protein H